MQLAYAGPDEQLTVNKEALIAGLGECFVFVFSFKSFYAMEIIV